MSMLHYLFKIHLFLQIVNEEPETDLIKQLRAGVYNGLLPETPEELRQMINELTVKKPYLPRPLLNGYLQIKSRLSKEHKKSMP